MTSSDPGTLSARGRLSSEKWRGQVERGTGAQLPQLCEERLQLDAAVRGRVGREPAERLLELSLGADASPASGLVPGDRHVDEALQEVPFVRRCGAPRLFELLVRVEVAAGANQLDAATEP